MTSLSNLKRGTQIQTSFLQENNEVEQFCSILPKKMPQPKPQEQTQEIKEIVHTDPLEVMQGKRKLECFVTSIEFWGKMMKQLVEHCNEGEAEILTFYRNLRDLEAICKKSIDLVQENAISQAHNAGETATTMYGLEIGYSAEYLDYDQDPEYSNLKKQLKIREEALKNAYKGLLPTIDKETGEVIPRVKIKTLSKAYLKRTR